MALSLVTCYIICSLFFYEGLAVGTVLAHNGQRHSACSSCAHQIRDGHRFLSRERRFEAWRLQPRLSLSGQSLPPNLSGAASACILFRLLFVGFRRECIQIPTHYESPAKGHQKTSDYHQEKGAFLTPFLLMPQRYEKKLHNSSQSDQKIRIFTVFYH